jgi:hypothetical protein
MICAGIFVLLGEVGALPGAAVWLSEVSSKKESLRKDVGYTWRESGVFVISIVP